MNTLPKGMKNSDLLGTRYLYHGTSAAAWLAIHASGAIEPRGDASGNWGHTALSHEGVIYLTTAYAAYFAACSSRQEQSGVVIEIDADALEPSQLCCDEDAYALIDLKQANPTKTPRELVELAKKTLPVGIEYAVGSLRLMGNCGHVAKIPLNAITRVVSIDWSANAQLAHTALEPVITPINYELMGSYYRKLTQWLFGEDSTEPDDPLAVGMRLPGSRDGLEVCYSKAR